MSASLAPLWLQAQQAGISPWIWIVLVVVVIILLLWWLGRSEPAETDAPRVEQKSTQAVSEPAPQPVVDESRVAEVVETPVKPDDLVIIEGIGPKIASVLQENGITTFAQLAAADVASLRAILLAASLRLADPATWPDQARLAAEGRWSDLQAMQNGLRAGRKAA